jgi:hypothetical protein
MMLPVRGTPPAASLPDKLSAGPEHAENGLPWLHGELRAPTQEPQMLTVRVHNNAGIPVIVGHALLEAGAQHITIRDLLPLGIEAYAHYSAEQRLHIAQRVWSRVAYATLSLSETTV